MGESIPMGAEVNNKRLRNGVDHSRTHGIAKKPMLTKNGAVQSVRSSSALDGLRHPHLPLLYSESVHAKIWAVASKALGNTTPPTLFPEYTEPGGHEYVYRDLQFWTSGFFPGSLLLLLERTRRYPRSITSSLSSKGVSPHRLTLEYASQWWTEELHANAVLEGTHDLGFMVMPWARLRWEMNHDAQALSTITTAARTLADRFDAKVGAIRSWDVCNTKLYSFDENKDHFLVIIDNMMNLDLLFYAAAQTNDKRLFDVAKEHAHTSRSEHVRSDFSTTHVVNFDRRTGDVKERLTNQGMAHESCWSRGQAWAIAGFAETYGWTNDASFLETSKACADYFLRRLPDSKIPPWDFDAAQQSPDDVHPPDVSAAMIAAYGMLLIHEALLASGQTDSHYLERALEIADAVCKNHMNPAATFSKQAQKLKVVEHEITQVHHKLSTETGHGDTILNGATINNFEFAPRRWADHGLVYADYFFILFGNKLLKMGIGQRFFSSA